MLSFGVFELIDPEISEEKKKRGAEDAAGKQRREAREAREAMAMAGVQAADRPTADSSRQPSGQRANGPTGQPAATRRGASK